MAKLLKLTDTIIERFNLVFLLHDFRSCLTEQMIFITFKKRSSQIDGSAFLKTELLNFSSGSLFPDENMAASFPHALGS